jgi:hypothetical protein
MGLIGSAIQGLGSIFGGYQASKAMKKVKDNIEAQREQNRNWYDARYNEDATQRADAQRILARTEELIKNRNNASAGASAVMGGTNESLAAQRAANANVIADTMSAIDANNAQRKDNIESTYLSNDAKIVDSLNQMEKDKANEISKAVQGLSSVVGDL